MTNSSARVLRGIIRDCQHLGSEAKVMAPASARLCGRGLLSANGSMISASRGASDTVPRQLRPFVQGASRPLAASIRHALRGAGPESDSFLEEVATFVCSQRQLHACSDQSGATGSPVSSAGFASDSDAGLRVEAVSGFVRDEQQYATHGPELWKVFACNFRLQNAGDRWLRVVGMQCDVWEATGTTAPLRSVSAVDAIGLEGRMPLLRPGASFEFGRAVPLRAERGFANCGFIAIEEPEIAAADKALHDRVMTHADLAVRFAYLESLGGPQFLVPLRQLHFDASVPAIHKGWLDMASRRPMADDGLASSRSWGAVSQQEAHSPLVDQNPTARR